MAANSAQGERKTALFQLLWIAFHSLYFNALGPDATDMSPFQAWSEQVSRLIYVGQREYF